MSPVPRAVPDALFVGLLPHLLCSLSKRPDQWQPSQLPPLWVRDVSTVTLSRVNVDVQSWKQWKVCVFLFSTLRLHLNKGLNLKTFLIYLNFTFNSILTIMEWKGFNKVPGQENQDWTINQYGQVQHPNHRSCNCFATQNVSQHTIINAALWCDRDAPAYIFLQFLQTQWNDLVRCKNHVIIITLIFSSVKMKCKN